MTGTLELQMSRKELFTSRLTFACLTCAFGCIIYGYDTSLFNGMQSLPSFTADFGENGKLSTHNAAVMNSVAYTGKGLGAFVAGPIVERWGHRWGMFAMCACAVVGVVVQMTSYSVAQFTVSRVIIFGAIGLLETSLCGYIAELCPPRIRGMMVSLVQFMQSPGGLLAAGMNRAFYKDQRHRIWLIPSGIQFIWPAGVLLALPFLPDSPRWLLSKGRREKAKEVLYTIRNPKLNASGDTDAEFQTMEDNLEKHGEGKGQWMDLVKGANLRRTWIVCSVLTFQQTMGSTFVSSYAVPFWIKAGLGANAFNYSLGLSAAGFVGMIIGQQLYDRIGRRPILLFGSCALFVTMLVVGVLGVTKDPYTHTKGLVMVAMVILFAPAFVPTWGAVPYIIASEVGSPALREKTLAVGLTVNVVWQFTTTYVTPYLIAAIDAKVGFIFAAVCVIGVFWVFFCLPETKNKSLEELDDLFARGVPARKFGKASMQAPTRPVSVDIDTESEKIVKGAEDQETVLARVV